MTIDKLSQYREVPNMAMLLLSSFPGLPAPCVCYVIRVSEVSERKVGTFHITSGKS